MKLFTLLAALLFLLPASPARADTLATLAAGGKGGWLNVTRPLTADDMAGRLVLLDFWTYGCINCMQVIPDLEYLEKKFGAQLLIIGVHSAKFDGEKDNARILAAAKRFGLNHPVINDSDYAIWKSFQVRAWPTLILLDSRGQEITRFRGEGHRADLENAIAKALPSLPGKIDAFDTNLTVKDQSQDILSFPARLAHDGKHFYAADSGHHRIVAFDATGTVTQIIGSGTRGLQDGDFKTAQFNMPRGLTVAGSTLYVADTNNHAIRKIDLESGTVTTLAGNGTKGRVASPWDIEMTGAGMLAIAMAGRHQLYALDPATLTMTVIAGSGHEDLKDGPAPDAALAQPSGLSQSGDVLFFVDAESSSLRMLDQQGVRTISGTGLFDFGFTDGPGKTAKLQHPQGLSADDARVIIADTYNNALRVYDRASEIISTLALKTTLHEPGDVIVVNGMAYIADTNSHSIIRVDLNNGDAIPIPLRLP